MKRFGSGAVLVMLMILSGCAKDNLDSLHLVSAEEVSVQKRQAPAATAQSAKTAASTAPAPAASVAEAAVPAPTPTPAAQ